MKKTFYSITALFATIALVSCGSGNKQNKSSLQAATPVTVTKIPTKDITTFSSYPTNMEGIVNAEIRPKISGYITNVLVDEGEKVHKGQVMFKLETASLSEQAAAAKANINAAQIKVDQLKPLVRKNIVSQSQLETAKAQLAQAKGQYQSITAQIGYAVIKSPVNGVVGEIRVRQGNLVSPNDQQPITTVSDISKVYAYFSMNEQDYLDFLMNSKGKTRAEKIKHLPQVTLIMANGDTYKEKGTIQAVNSQIDPQTGSVSFRATFANPEGFLTNGSTGTIKVPKTYNDVLVVPQTATYQLQDHIIVMKIKQTSKGDIATSQTIHVKDTKGNLYLVASGLTKGEEIITKDVDKIRDGALVKPTVVPFDSVAKPIKAVFIKN